MSLETKYVTLQHRHELLCGFGVSIRACCYDTSRHHILIYTSSDLPPSPSKNPLIPNPILTEHTLRVYSLKREIKKRHLFDQHATNIAPNAVKLSLTYSSSNDIYICVYSIPRDDVCAVEILEPASLDKLYQFRGGVNNMIQCSTVEDDYCNLIVCSRCSSGISKQDAYVIQAWSIARDDKVRDPAHPSPVQIVSKPSLAPSLHQVLALAASPTRVFGIALESDGTDDVKRPPSKRTGLYVWDRSTRQIIRVHNGFENGQLLTTLRLSLCHQWLFSGHAGGSLSIWNVGYEISRLYQIGPGSVPYRCLCGESLHPSGIASITAQPKIENDNGTEMEMDVFISSREPMVKHCRFRTTLNGQGDIDTQFDIIGDFEPSLPSKTKGKHRRVFCLPIDVDMGHSNEHLLLVAVESVVHVLKIQSLARSVYTPKHESQRIFATAMNNEVSPSFLAILASDGVISLLTFPTSTTATPSYHTSSTQCNSLLHDCARTIDTFGLLKRTSPDPQLNTPVCCIVAIALPIQKVNATNSETISWGGRLCSKPLPVLEALPKLEEQSPYELYVCVGANDGSVFAWSFPVKSSKFAHFKAQTKWNAHSTQVFSLLSLLIDESHRGIVSVTCDGQMKVWKLTSPVYTPVMLSHFSFPQPNRVVTSSCLIKQEQNLHLLVCGHESGSLIAYHMHSRFYQIEMAHDSPWEIEWKEIYASEPHQLRISTIRPVPHPGRINPPSNIIMHCTFATASYDGHVIVWAVDALKNTILERRYFEFCAPVQDAFIQQDVLIVSLPHELCCVQYVYHETKKKNLEKKPIFITTSIGTEASLHDDKTERDEYSQMLPKQILECDIQSDGPVCPPPTRQRTVHELNLIFEAIRIHLGRDYATHLIEEEETISIPARDLCSIYKIWQSLEPSSILPFSQKRATSFLNSNHLQSVSMLTWKQVEDALLWCSYNDSKRMEKQRSYKNMGIKRALVRFNEFGEKQVTYIEMDQSSRRSCGQTPDTLLHDIMKIETRNMPPQSRSIYLPLELASYWRNGFCWCTGLLIIETNKKYSGEPEKACVVCKKRQHYVRADSVFSERSTIFIVHQIYKSMQLEKERRNNWANIALVPFLFDWFRRKFGMQSVVEHKLYWFVISIAEHSASIEITSSFGLFCNIFRDIPALPLWLLYLYIDGFGWLHNHHLVYKGEALPGAQGIPAVDAAHKDKHSSWEMISLESCELCCRALLVYPRVPPKFIAQVLQVAKEKLEYNGIEVHAFLSSWVTAWKCTIKAFESASRQLFDSKIRPDIASVSEEFTKLQFILDCFIYYDHRRDGCVEQDAFRSILMGLQNLWPDIKENTDIENEIDRLMERYGDFQVDGFVCYLDMFSLLYVVTLKTKTYMKFTDIYAFSKGYKLELDEDYKVAAVEYMENMMFHAAPPGVVGDYLDKSFQLNKSKLHSLSSDNFEWTRTFANEETKSSLTVEDLAFQVTPASFHDRGDVPLGHSQYLNPPICKNNQITAPYIPAHLPSSNSNRINSSTLRNIVDQTREFAARPVKTNKYYPAPTPITVEKSGQHNVHVSTMYIQFPDVQPFAQSRKRITTVASLKDLNSTLSAPATSCDDRQLLQHDEIPVTPGSPNEFGNQAADIVDKLKDDKEYLFGVEEITNSTQNIPETSPVHIEDTTSSITIDYEQSNVMVEQQFGNDVPSLDLNSNEEMDMEVSDGAQDDTPQYEKTQNVQSISGIDESKSTIDANDQPESDHYAEATCDSNRDYSTVEQNEQSIVPAIDIIAPPDMGVDDANDVSFVGGRCIDNIEETKNYSIQPIESPKTTSRNSITSIEPDEIEEQLPPLEDYVSYGHSLLAAMETFLNEPLLKLQRKMQVEFTRETSVIKVLDIEAVDLDSGDEEIGLIQKTSDDNNAEDAFEPMSSSYGHDLAQNEGLQPSVDETPREIIRVSVEKKNTDMPSSPRSLEVASDSLQRDDTLEDAIERRLQSRQKNGAHKTKPQKITAPPEAASSTAPTKIVKQGDMPHVKRREFLFSQPVDLKPLYKKRLKPSFSPWNPMDDSDDEMDVSPQRRVEYSVSVDGSTDHNDSTSGDIVLSPRLAQNISDRWSQLFSSEETDIHEQLDNAFKATSEESNEVYIKKISQPEDTSTMESHTEEACIRSKTRKRLSLFRAERKSREGNCCPTALIMGDVVSGNLTNNEVAYYVYTNTELRSIVTIKLHCECGDAELYVSTDTPAPSVRDCEWRSKPSLMTDSSHKKDKRVIVHPKDRSAKRGVYYIAVSSHSEGDTQYNLCVMSSGQSLVLSDSMEHVDALMSRFNGLATMVSNPSDKLGDDDGEYLQLERRLELLRINPNTRRGTIDLLHASVQNEGEEVGPPDMEDNSDDQAREDKEELNERYLAFEVLMEKLTQRSFETEVKDVDHCDHNERDITSSSSAVETESDEGDVHLHRQHKLTDENASDIAITQIEKRHDLQRGFLKTPNLVAYSYSGSTKSKFK
ncbi:hypothetical protein Ae201684_005880 [Aphanomyces euteiches]|uniref:Uncharacterized protein n=1 Tax=Aphanomyces euteiches TaxID=100861 RepID=A0A6G0XDM6_9STRA|nr:hypothetical protein Ae201684_005880 [Aphanomyces euteiches]